MRRPWIALGYDSIASWWSGEGLTSIKLSVEDRRQVVSMMYEEGTSKRSIAKAVGVSRDTVDRSLVTSTGAEIGTPSQELTLDRSKKVKSPKAPTVEPSLEDIQDPTPQCTSCPEHCR